MLPRAPKLTFILRDKVFIMQMTPKKIFPVKSQVQVCSWPIFRRLPTGSTAPLSRRRHESDWIRTGRVLFCPSASFFRIQLVTSQRCISRISYSAAGLRNEIAARSIPSSNLKQVKFRLAVLSECVLPPNYHTKLPESVMKNILLPKSCDLTWFAKNSFSARPRHATPCAERFAWQDQRRLIPINNKKNNKAVFKIILLIIVSHRIIQDP